MSDEESGKDSPRRVESQPEMDVEAREPSPEPRKDEADERRDSVADTSKKPTIYVGDLPRYISETDLSEFFGKRGKLSRCEIKPKHGRYCFVEYEDDAITEEVLRDYEKNPPKLKDHVLKVERARGRRELSCFNCKKPGHKAADCPEPPRRRRSSRGRDHRSRRSSSRGRSRSSSYSRGRGHSRSRSRSRSRSHSRHSHSRHYRRSRSRSYSRDRYSHGRHDDRDSDRDRRDSERDRRDSERDRRSSRHEDRRSSHRDSSSHRRSRSASRSPRRS